MVINVEIIGPFPPCIRCHRIYKMLKAIRKEANEDIEISRIYACSEEAMRYGKIVEPEIFAESIGEDIDFKELFKRRDIESIDKKLGPLVERAKKAGVLLTPVLIIDGEIKTIGRVPSKEMLKKFLQIN